MSLLTIIQAAANEIGIDSPSSVIGNTDATVMQLLAFLKHEGLELRSMYAWPELTKEHTFTLATSTASYALPTDFDWQIARTHWDRTNKRELNGPLSPQEWQFRKSGLVTSSIVKNFRVKGSTDTQFSIDPTPTSDDNGATMAFEYQSTNWVRPKTWTTATVFAGMKYSWYNGNIYYTTSGGTTGATPPTHTTGTSSDGGVSWTYQNIVYEEPQNDADEFLLEPKLIKLGTKWRFLQQKGLEYIPIMAEWTAASKRQIAGYRGSKTITVGRRAGYPFIGYLNIPDTGY